MRVVRQYFRYLRSSLLLNTTRLISLVISIGIILILLSYVTGELQTDTFNKQLDRIYRIEIEGAPTLPSVLAEAAFPGIPEIIHFCRVNGMERQLLFVNRNLSLYSDVLYVDSAFFEIFNYRLSLGNQANALKENNSIVLTRDESFRLFGEENPVGRKIFLNNQVFVTVTGVYDKPARQSSLPYLNLVSYGTLASTSYDIDYRGPLTSWNNWSVNEIVLLLPGNPDIDKIGESIMKRTPWHDNPEDEVELSIRPFADYHFRSSEAQGNFMHIIIISAAILLIVFFSISNHTYHSFFFPVCRPDSLFTKKASGSRNTGIWTEIFLFTFTDYLIALLLSLVLVRTLFYFIEPFFGFNPGSGVLISPVLILIMSAIGIFQSAVVSTRIVLAMTKKPLYCLIRSSAGMNDISPINRKVFMLFQFIIALICLTVLLGANRQVVFSLRSIPLQNSGLLTMNISSMDEAKRTVLKEALLKLPEVKNVYLTNYSPGERIRKEGGVRISSEGTNASGSFRVFYGSHDYINIYRTSLAEGRYFEDPFSDAKGAIVNQEFIRRYDIKHPLGTRLMYEQDDVREVIGVIEDFHYEKINSKIAPLVIYNNERSPGKYGYYCIIEPQSKEAEYIQTIRDTIGNLDKSLFKDLPVEMYPVSQRIGEIHKNEITFRNVSAIFLTGAILILLAGIISLSQLVCKQRQKEIGIRKINGAGIPDVIRLIMKGFMWQFILSFAISLPVSIIILTKWMEQFEYKVQLPLWLFAASGLAVVTVSLIVIYLKTWSAANTDPVKILRSQQ